MDPPEGDPGSWPGEAKIAERAVEVGDQDAADQPHLFSVDVLEVVITRVGTPPDHLVIESWHPGRGLEVQERR